MKTLETMATLRKETNKIADRLMVELKPHSRDHYVIEAAVRRELFAAACVAANLVMSDILDDTLAPLLKDDNEAINAIVNSPRHPA